MREYSKYQNLEWRGHPMMDRIARICERRPHAVIFLVVLLSCFMAYGVTKVSMTTDFKKFLPESYPSVRTTLELENKFGSISSEMILLKADDVTKAEVIRGILALETTLRSDPRLENYARMYYSYVDYVIQYIPNYELLPDDQLEASIEALLENFSANPQTSGTISRLITADRRAAVIYIYINTKLARSELMNKTTILRERVENFEKTYANFAASVGGTYSSYNDIRAMMNRDNRVLIPAAMILVAVILFLTFRRFSDILLCLMVICLGSMWAIGTMGHLGLEFTMVHVALVPLLLGMGVDYSIYMLNRYYEGRGKGLRAEKAVRVSASTIGVAILTCVITTVIGFASFSISDIPPIQTLGILAGLGIFFTFILATILLPSIVILRDRGKTGKVKAIVAKRGKNIDRMLSSAATGAEHRRKLVILVVAGVAVLCIISALGVSTTMSFETFLPSDVESIATQNEIEELFGGQSQLFVIARGNLMTPGSLMSMYLFENAVISDRNNQGQLITGSLSLRKMVYSQALATGENLFSLTESKIAAIVENLRKAPSTRTYMNMLLTEDNSEATILFYVNARTDKEMKQATEIVRTHVQGFTGEFIDLTTNGVPAVGGGPAIIADILGSITPGMMKTTLVALILCFVVLAIIFRSLWMGAMCILPVALVVTWELGTLRLLGWSLDVLTMGISALIIGSGIDYSIQMVYRFREEWKTRGRSPQESIRTTVMNTGTSILAAMATTVGVFAVLALSRMPALGRFGSLTAIVITYAFLAALFVLPCVIMFYALRKRKVHATGKH
jgi:hydrophobe/amphiphile efflux-3 (HAE3) family protein